MALRGKVPGDKWKTHGMTRSRTYVSWNMMIARCYNQSSPSYYAYGAKGIRVCDRWRNSFEAFLEDMGVRPDGMTLDRKDATKNYEKDNCKWATRKEQAREKQRLITHNGKTMSVTEWASYLGVKRQTLSQRINGCGMSLEKALVGGVLWHSK